MLGENPYNAGSGHRQPRVFRMDTNRETNLDSGDPFSDSILPALAVHNSRAASAPEKRVALILARCLAEMGNLFARGDVMGADESVKECHWRGIMAV